MYRYYEPVGWRIHEVLPDGSLGREVFRQDPPPPTGTRGWTAAAHKFLDTARDLNAVGRRAEIARQRIGL